MNQLKTDNCPVTIKTDELVYVASIVHTSALTVSALIWGCYENSANTLLLSEAKTNRPRLILILAPILMKEKKQKRLTTYVTIGFFKLRSMWTNSRVRNTEPDDREVS